MGGNEPIVGAHVFVYAANSTGGYGSASTSLIQPGAGTANDPSLGNYVTTDMNGVFSYAGTITCPAPTTQIYLLAVGGNGSGNQPAAGNSAIALMASLGAAPVLRPAPQPISTKSPRQPWPSPCRTSQSIRPTLEHLPPTLRACSQPSLRSPTLPTARRV